MKEQNMITCATHATHPVMLCHHWLLNFKVKVGGTAPPPRQHHIMHCHNEEVYLFGGQDELGAQSLQLFKLPVPRASAALAAAGTPTIVEGDESREVAPVEVVGLGSAQGLKGEWMEVDSELVYNKSR